MSSELQSQRRLLFNVLKLANKWMTKFNSFELNA